MDEFKDIFISKEFSMSVCLIIDGFIKRIVLICETPQLNHSDIKALENITREWLRTFDIIRSILFNANELNDNNLLKDKINRLLKEYKNKDESELIIEFKYIPEFEIRAAISRMLFEIEEKKELLRWRGDA